MNTREQVIADIENARDNYAMGRDIRAQELLDRALTALRSIEQGEPVAWMSEQSGSIVKHKDRQKMSKSWKEVYCIPLYAGEQGGEGDPWIPVSERLPERGVTVMVWDPRNDADHEPGMTMDALDPDSDGIAWIEHSSSYEHYVACSAGVPSIGPPEEAPYTHWMPLTRRTTIT